MIQVTIEGPCMSGKSALAEEIQSFIRDTGAECVVFDDYRSDDAELLQRTAERNLVGQFDALVIVKSV